MLVVENLAVSGGGKEILHGASLELGRAETMVIMGRNGSGKSTLANAIMRNPKLLVTSGRAVFDGQDLAQLATHEIAARGIFFAPQHMPAIDGLAVSSLLKNSANALRAARGKEPLSAPEFARLAKEYSAIAGVPREWMSRAYGAGFSGGEKKIAQCMEMLFSDASLCILDEPDSGADAGAVDRIIASIDFMRARGASVIAISHYPRLIEALRPQKVAVMDAGRIVLSGGIEIARAVEKGGFDAIL